MELKYNKKTNNPKEILNNAPKRNTTGYPTLLRFNLSIAQRILNKSALAGLGGALWIPMGKPIGIPSRTP